MEVRVMKYFEMTVNIGSAGKGFRAIVGMTLLGVVLAHPTPMPTLYATAFPMIGAYFVLTAIMEWDPIVYLVQSTQNILNSFGQPKEPLILSVDNPKEMAIAQRTERWMAA